MAAALATAAGPWLLRPARRAAWWVVWLVALGRMYAGVHLPLDVLGGAALGWAVAAGVDPPDLHAGDDLTLGPGSILVLQAAARR